MTLYARRSKEVKERGLRREFGGSKEDEPEKCSLVDQGISGRKVRKGEKA